MRPIGRASSDLLLLSLCLAAAGCAPHVGASGHADAAAPGTTTTALAVDSALGAIAARLLWPRFTPLSTPLAIFDGTRTYLFRHPAPPAGYVALRGRPDVLVRDGRDPAITANTSASLGGVATAIVMLDPRSGTADAAALTVHELFHVFQRARHPDWQANEADLFTYPVEDTVALALRREETMMLHNALSASSPADVRCWAGAFMQARVARFARIGDAAAKYDRGTELNEGLARYVERRAAARQVALAEEDAPAGQVRQRSYDVGAAIAQVLTRMHPGWEEEFDAFRPGSAMTLDGPLYTQVTGLTPSGPCPSPTPAQRTAWAAQAGEDVRALAAERQRMRAEYLGRPGWRVVVDAGPTPFFPQGFDPLNVVRLSPTEILHGRFLKLQGSRGTIETMSRASLTEGGAGAHPLFNGVVRVTMAGLPDAPAVRDSSGLLVLEAPGLYARLRGARADTASHTIRIRLP